MKPVVALFAACAFFVPAAFAQTSAPPPPGLHDPGVKATAPQKKPAGKLDLKAPMVPATTPATQPQTASREALPQVSVEQRGDDTVQEYRRNGQLYMVVVTPKSGIPQTYMVDPSGRWIDEHGKKPISPVMYKIMEWGKSRPAEAASSDDSGR
jgi:hypothetical protein